MHPSSDPSYRGYLLARLLRGHVVWPAAGLAATAIYLLMLAGLRQVTSRLG